MGIFFVEALGPSGGVEVDLEGTATAPMALI